MRAVRPSVPAAAELAVEDGVLHPLVVLGVGVALGLVLRLGRAPLAQRLGSLRVASNGVFVANSFSLQADFPFSNFKETLKMETQSNGPAAI